MPKHHVVCDFTGRVSDTPSDRCISIILTGSEQYLFVNDKLLLGNEVYKFLNNNKLAHHTKGCTSNSPTDILVFDHRCKDIYINPSRTSLGKYANDAGYIKGCTSQQYHARARLYNNAQLVPVCTFKNGVYSVTSYKLIATRTVQNEYVYVTYGWQYWCNR